MSDFRLHVVPFTPRHWSVSDDEHYSYGTWPKKKVAIEQGNCLAAEIGCELLIHNSKGKITKRSFPNHSQPSMPKRKKTQTRDMMYVHARYLCDNCQKELGNDTGTITTAKFADEPDPFSPSNLKANLEAWNAVTVRSRSPKTDQELFAEWEEYRSQVERPEMHYWVSDHVTALKDNIAAIAKELGPKLMEMRVAKLDQCLKFTRKCLFEELGYKDVGNDCFTKEEEKPLLPWWQNLLLSVFIGFLFICIIQVISAIFF